MTTSQQTLEAVVIAYMQCALWSSTDDDEPLDGLYETWDFTDEAQASIIEDCEGFLDLLSTEGEQWELGWTAEQLGHDFWLTRNGHGAGFWDRYWNGSALDLLGDRLSTWAKSFGESDVCVGNDGKLHVS